MHLEADTVRLHTLRMLLGNASPLAVVHVSTPLVDLAPLVRDDAWVIAVDDAGCLAGLMSHRAAVTAILGDPDGWVADHMTRSSLALQAECEVGDALRSLRGGADHLVVVDALGELLGVLVADDLVHAAPHKVAA